MKANNLATLSFKVRQLLAEPGRLKQMKFAAIRTGRPRAAFDIVAAALSGHPSGA